MSWKPRTSPSGCAAIKRCTGSAAISTPGGCRRALCGQSQQPAPPTSTAKIARRSHGFMGVDSLLRRKSRSCASHVWRSFRVEHSTRVRSAATRRKDCGRAAVNAPGHPEATRAPASSAGRRRLHSGRVLHPEFAATRKKVAWTSVQTPRRLWTEVQAALRRAAVFALPKRGGSPAGCRLRRAGSPRSPFLH